MISIPRLLLILFALAGSHAAWAEIVDDTQFGNVVYLVDQGNRRVVRYDAGTAKWLSSITSTYVYTPKYVTVNASGVFVGFDYAVYRYDLNGNGEALVTETSEPITDIQVLGDLLVVGHSHNRFLVFDADSLAQTDSGRFNHPCSGLSAAPDSRRIFCRVAHDIHYLEFDASGQLTKRKNSPYHGHFAGADRTYVFPDQARVAENNGLVYDSASLDYSGSLAGAFDELVFVGDVPIVRRGKTLVANSENLRETGIYRLSRAPDAMGSLANGSLVAFSQDGAEIAVETASLNDFRPRGRKKETDPTDLAYSPDDYALDAANGILYLFSKKHGNIFRWSVEQQRYLSSIRLSGSPDFMAISADSGLVYVADTSGRIYRVDPATHDLTHVVTVPFVPSGLHVTDTFIYMVGHYATWRTHYTFDPEDGSLISESLTNPYTKNFVWNEKNSRMYFLDDGISPRDLHWMEVDPVTGVIGESRESPYHSSSGMRRPVRISPDGGLVLLGSGRIFDALSLEQVNALGSGHADAAWIGGMLHTMGETRSGSAYIQQWSRLLKPLDRYSVVSKPLRIFDVNGSPLVVYSVAGVPRFETDLTQLDGDFDDDGVRDEMDDFPDDPHEYVDFDGDGIGDTADSDDDGDGVADKLDAFPLDASESVDSDGDGLGDNADRLVGDNAAAYYPLDTGNWWSYDSTSVAYPATVQPNSVFLNHRIRHARAISDGRGTVAYLNSDDRGLLRYGFLNQGLEEVYVPPLKWLNPVVSVGDRTSTSGRVYIKPRTGGSVNWSLNSSLEVTKETTVDTPAGTFTAIEVSGTLHVTGSVGTQRVDEVVEVTEWFAKGIGLVKTQSVIDGKTEVDHLRSTSLDQDQDTVGAMFDNCVDVSNPEQTDTDRDGWGDACDYDDDGDSITDIRDNCPLRKNSFQADFDNDRLGNVCDDDDDNDGVIDGDDRFPRDASEWADTDGDGIGDNTDLDDDGDGMSDADEIRFGLNPLSAADAAIDSDGDGETNIEEVRIGSDPLDPRSNYRARINGVNTIINTILAE